MQPGYPNPQLPQNPMQPSPLPSPAQYPAPSYQPAPQPQAYPIASQSMMNDIAPPQAYSHNVSSPTYPTQPPAPTVNSSQPPNTNYMPPMPQPMNDIVPSTPSFSQPTQPINPMHAQPPPSYQSTPQLQTYSTIPPPTRPELVQNIPVRAPAPQPVAPLSNQPYAPPQQRPENPFNSPTRPAPPATGDFNDNRMDDILKDVNRDVSRPDQKNQKPVLPVITDKLKLSKLKTHTKKAVTHPKPVMIVGLAVVTFLSLAMAAFFAFNNDSSARPAGPEVKVVGTTAAAGDSIQAGGGTLVSSQEVEDLSSTLKQQVGGFNDSQDFNQDPLSDQALGL